MRRAIRSKRVVTPEALRPATVVFDQGAILAVEDAELDLGSLPLLDVGELVVLPGLVDTHVHINDPGRSEWEGFATASRAAAAGGFTCLVDMPLNCIPATIDVSSLEQKRRAATGTCVVDHAFWGGAVKGNSANVPSLARAGVRGFKSFLVDSGVAEFAMVEEQDLRKAMPLIAETGLPLLVHAEDPAIIAGAQKAEENADPRRYRTYLKSRPDEAERVAIQRLIRLCREFGCRVHIVHLSSATALPALRQAREEGLPLTVETCPHYLWFTAEQIPDGATEFKCAPPLRDAENRERLWHGLQEGVIDLIATDHSPCPPAMKETQGDFLKAWGGIASLSVAFSVTWSAAQRRGFSIVDVVRWMSQRPAELAGLGAHKGSIAPGCDADFVVFDPDAPFIVQPADLHFRHPLSPYIGEHLQGRVETTFLRGSPIFENRSFVGACRGRECRVSEWSTAL